MPYYDYRCKNCHSKFTLFFKTYTDYDKATPVCKTCDSTQVTRLIGRVAVAKSEERRMDALTDESALAGIDEDDPRSIGQFMRKMSNEMGEDLGDEFNEVVDRLEKGQAPEEIEQSMPTLTDGDAATDPLS